MLNHRSANNAEQLSFVYLVFFKHFWSFCHEKRKNVKLIDFHVFAHCSLFCELINVWLAKVIRKKTNITSADRYVFLREQEKVFAVWMLEKKKSAWEGVIRWWSAHKGKKKRPNIFGSRNVKTSGLDPKAIVSYRECPFKWFHKRSDIDRKRTKFILFLKIYRKNRLRQPFRH